MRDAEKILKGAAQTFSGQILGQVFSLLRNLIVARLLIPEDFGVAATFAVTLSALDMMSDLSFHKMMVQAKEGQDPVFQKVMHTLNFLRGLVIALMLFFSAGWIANVFDIPEAKSSYQLLALAPLIRSFLHLDIYRYQRDLSFSSEVKITVASQLAGLIVAVVLTYMTRHYDAVLWAVLAQATIFTLGSHWVAERPFRLGITRQYARQAWDLGWPLMVNGMIIMLATQADRILVGAQLGLTSLAIYTVATLLVNTTGFLLTKLTSTLGLPWLSSVQTTRDIYETRYDLLGHMIGVVTILSFVPLALIGADIIYLLFGENYAVEHTLMGWLSLAAALRYMRCRMNNAAFAVGDSKNLMLSNMVRISGLLLAVVAVYQGLGVVVVAMAMAFGEAAGLVVATLRLKITAKLPVKSASTTTALVIISLLGVISLTGFQPDLTLLTRFTIACIMPVVISLIMLAISPQLQKLLRSIPSMVGNIARFRS